MSGGGVIVAALGEAGGAVAFAVGLDVHAVFFAAIGDAAVNGGADAGGCDYLGELGHGYPAVWVRLEVVSKLFVLGVPALVGPKV